MAIDGPYSEEGGLIHWKTSIGLEPAGSQKERKTVETWKRTVVEEAEICSKTWGEV